MRQGHVTWNPSVCTRRFRRPVRTTDSFVFSLTPVQQSPTEHSTLDSLDSWTANQEGSESRARHFERPFLLRAYSRVHELKHTSRRSQLSQNRNTEHNILTHPLTRAQRRLLCRPKAKPSISHGQNHVTCVVFLWAADFNAT